MDPYPFENECVRSKKGVIIQNIDSILQTWNLPIGDPQIIRHFEDDEYAVLYSDNSFMLTHTISKKRENFHHLRIKKLSML
ncbi:hypothetical protein L950_0203030 [Sphingobacterium sp. IITKGP-BTPF85]|nr:hypothetical protein L950_0203030 [Sphingobacterium sp. IITKGP-BTPF85]